MVACRCSPSLIVYRDQATTLWPLRSTASDGCCASAAHHQQSPNSDHEPHVEIRGQGYATAFDLTHDPNYGCNVAVVFDDLIRAKDTRVKYLIRNRRIWFPTGGRNPAGWSAYHGTNPHDKHGHMSIVPTAVFDTRPWPIGGVMATEDQIMDAINLVFTHVKALESVLFVPPDAQGKVRPNLGTLVAELDRRGRVQGLDFGWVKEALEKIAKDQGVVLPPQPGK